MVRWVWLSLFGAGVVTVIVATKRARFARRVAADARVLWAGGFGAPPIESSHGPVLPNVVRRYLNAAVGEAAQGIRTARLRQSGTFRTSLTGAWLPLRGEQYLSADPPGFVWWGRVRAPAGIWVDAHDRSVEGTAGMFVSLLSTIPLANVAGPELDESAMQRLLGELVWLPSALLDSRSVSWRELDARRAEATLRIGAKEAKGIFEFREDGLPALFAADRYRDLGGGKSERTPFTGEYSEYRRVGGMLVPHQLTGYWHVEGERVPFARFRLERLDASVTAPF